MKSSADSRARALRSNVQDAYLIDAECAPVPRDAGRASRAIVAPCAGASTMAGGGSKVTTVGERVLAPRELDQLARSRPGGRGAARQRRRCATTLGPFDVVTLAVAQDRSRQQPTSRSDSSSAA